jgi:tetratricopeptide (TPR) repeat protein
MADEPEPGSGCPLADKSTPSGTPAERQDLARHLLKGCPACRARLARALAPAAGDSDLDAIFRRVAARTKAFAPRVAADRRSAKALLARLERQSPAGRRLYFVNCSDARRRAICELLIERARDLRHRDTTAYLQRAREIVEVAELMVAAEHRSLRARAWAELGNALRITGNLTRAFEALWRAETLDRADGHDRRFTAELLSLQGSLLLDQRNFREARARLRKSSRLYTSCGDERGRGRVLVQLGIVSLCEGQPAAAIPPLLQALEISEATRDRALKLTAGQSLIRAAAENGDADTAAFWIAEARPLFAAAAPRLDQLKFEWLAARVDAQRGLLATAARELSLLRQQYLDEDLPYHVALVSLDLAEVFGRQKRRARLGELVRETVELFRSLGIARETIASLSQLTKVEQAEIAERVAALAQAVNAARRRKQFPTAEW